MSNFEDILGENFTEYEHDQISDFVDYGENFSQFLCNDFIQPTLVTLQSNDISSVFEDEQNYIRELDATVSNN